MLSIKCPHCAHEISDEQFRRLRGQFNVSKRWGRREPEPDKRQPEKVDREYDFGA